MATLAPLEEARKRLTRTPLVGRRRAGVALVTYPTDAPLDLVSRPRTVLEERVPWNAVKKLWAGRRGEYERIVGGSSVCSELAQQLLVLESMLKSDALSSAWPVQKTSWRARMSACHEPNELQLAVNELESAILWQRILVHQDGRPLSAAEIASGQYGVGGVPAVPLPPPLSVSAPAMPPEGVPRAASRMLLLLHDMGAEKYDPKVVVQLLDIMYGWTTHILLDASVNARMRTLPTSQYPAGPAYAPEPPIDASDVALAVRSRVEHGFTRAAAREVIAQQAADTNSMPMPILPKRTTVALPSDLNECEPTARALIQRGIDVGMAEEEPTVAEELRKREKQAAEKPPPKRQKH